MNDAVKLQTLRNNMNTPILRFHPISPVPPRQTITILVALAVLLWASTSLRAATYTWTGAGLFEESDCLWSTPYNWAELAAPQPGEQGVNLIFPNSNAPRKTTNDVLNLVISSVTFQASNYAIYGPTANGITMTLQGTRGSDFSIVSNGDNNQFAHGTRLHLGANGAIDVASGNTFYVYSRISGTFGFTKTDLGTLRLSGTNANTFTGATLVERGTLELNKGLVSPVVTNFVAIPGPLIIASSSNYATVRLLRDDQIGDSSAVTVNYKGTLNLNGYDDLIGSLTLAGGTVTSGAGFLRLNNNVEVYPHSLPIPSMISGKLDLGFLGRTFDCADDSELVVSAVISGGTFGPVGAGVTKSGQGVMKLTAANTFPGNVYVTGGDLIVDHVQALSTTNGYTSVGTNAVLVLFDDESFTNNPVVTNERLVLHGGSYVRVKNDCDWEGPIELAGGEAGFNLFSDSGADPVFRIRGTISGPGGFKKVGGGDIWMMGTDHNTYAGRTYVVEGKLALYQGGPALNRTSVPGPLFVGRPGSIENTTTSIVEVWKSETINSNQISVNHLGNLLFKGGGTFQTVSNLAVNGGVVDTGPTGMLKLTGAVGSTNYHDSGDIRGRLDLGNSQRHFHVERFRLDISAAVSGGPNATLELTGATHGILDLVNSNSFSGLTLIHSGLLFVEHSHALGSVNSGVIVTNKGRLGLLGNYGMGTQDVTVQKAFLHLVSDPNDVSAFPFTSSGTNVWKGPIWLGLDTTIRSHGQLTIIGPISGPGGVDIRGSGEVVFAGVGSDNTYAGPTRLTGGTLTLAKGAGLLVNRAVPTASIEIETEWDGNDDNYGRLRLARNNQVVPDVHISLGSDTTLEVCKGATNSIAKFSGQGDVEFSGGLLKAGFGNQFFQFYGRFQGGDPLAPTSTCFEKHGWGNLSLSKANSLTGAVDVVQGTLYLTGSLSNALVNLQGTLMGDGEVGSVRVDGGTFRPGYNDAEGAGDMHVRSCTGGIAGLHVPGILAVYVGGTNACDRLVVKNIADVENLRLDLKPGALNIPMGQKFLVISNQSAGSILGKLNHYTGGQDLTEGAKFFAGQQRFSISYTGGDGNDVVITREADPTPAQIGGISKDPDGMLINVSGEPGLLYRVEATFGFGGTNAWTQIGTATMNGSGFSNFVDDDAQLYPMRFYRFVAP